MKKGTLILILGIILTLSGFYLYVSKSEPTQTVEDKTLSRESAISIMKVLLLDTISVYENPSSYFDIEVNEENNLLKVLNYDEKIKQLFTENAILEFENMKFDGKNYVTKNEEGVFLLNSIPSDNSILNSEMNFENVNITSNNVTSKVTFSSASMDNEENVLYKIITKNITILKNGDNWYIESFNYSNK